MINSLQNASTSSNKQVKRLKKLIYCINLPEFIKQFTKVRIIPLIDLNSACQRNLVKSNEWWFGDFEIYQRFLIYGAICLASHLSVIDSELSE